MSTRAVCVDPAGIFHECQSPMDGSIGLSIDGKPVAAANQSLGYCRMAHNGVLGVVVGQGSGQDGLGGTILATSVGTWTRLGTSFGEYPVAIEWRATAGVFVIFAVMELGGNAIAKRFTLAPTGEVTDAPYPMRPTGSAEGFKDTVNGVPIWMDDALVTTLGGHPFWRYMTRGGLTLGQSDPVGVAVWDGGRYLVAFEGDAGPLQPLLAVSGDQVRIALSTEPDVPLLTEDDLVDYVPPPIRIPTPVLTYPVSIAPFKDPQGLTAADSEVVVNGALPTNSRPRWVASDPDSMKAFRSGIDHGIYTETFDSEELARVVRLAATLRTRVAFCHDGTDLDRTMLAHLRPCDQVWLECYRTKAETLAQSIARWHANLTALLAAWPHAVGLIPQDYDQGGVGPAEVWTVQDTLDACEAIPALANQSPRIVTVAPFEVLRANGASAHPELMEWTRRLIAATPGRPVLEPIDPIHPPPPPPPPHPPGPPSPSPIQQEHTMKIGDKGMFRAWGSNDPFVLAIVGDHNDKPTYWGVIVDQDVPALGVTRGQFAHFDSATGKFDGGRSEDKGTADERVTFDGRNIMVAQPSDKGAFVPHEWINRV